MNGIQKTILASFMLLAQNSSAISLKEQWNSFKKDNQHVSLAKAVVTGYGAYATGKELKRWLPSTFSSEGMLDAILTGGGAGIFAFCCYESLAQTLEDLNKGMGKATLPELPSTTTLTNKWSEIGGKSRVAAGGRAICSGLATAFSGFFTYMCSGEITQSDGMLLLYSAVITGLFADTTLRLGTQTWQDARLALTGTTSHSEESEDGTEQVSPEVAI